MTPAQKSFLKAVEAGSVQRQTDVKVKVGRFGVEKSHTFSWANTASGKKVSEAVVNNCLKQGWVQLVDPNPEIPARCTADFVLRHSRMTVQITPDGSFVLRSF